VITEVSLKVVPRPPVEVTLRFDDIDQGDAIARLNRFGARPLPISASVWHNGVLDLRLSGAGAAVRAACAALGGDTVDAAQADDGWSALREQTLSFFASDAVLWRVSVPDTAPVIALPGETLIEWSGALRWLKTDAPALTVREAARRAGGHATLFRPARGRQREAPCFTALDPVLERIHQRLKDEFDPLRLFNRGRLYAGL